MLIFSFLKKFDILDSEMKVIALLNDLTATIGENMRKYREKHEYTQKTVADLLNIDPQYYGEAGRGR